ncbi:hypothetical protein LUZ61_000615 [Rhynchospora tenuis]|uniref:Disease resistance R13L4/SHOC-2-like LRR domain-containing protein n=1 Tax=Rhynchospora tenuis TaxID=198213 RepID=A0AAD6EQ84_9POAL|nr:hypothetical protein LUZ61_000615 [Rhynchospora tenuis]
MPKGIGNLKELQVLKWVNLKRSHCRVLDELALLRQLRKLGVRNLRRKHYDKFSATISELNSLRYLGIGIAYGDEAAAGFRDIVLSPPEHLRSIELSGWIGTLPAWISSLSKLAKVTLYGTRLDDDGIVLLQELPNLLLLRLWDNSYVGPKLTFRITKFPKLKELIVSDLKNLEELLFEEGALSELQMLEISRCELKSGINGAKHLPKLKKLVLGRWIYVANLDEVQKQVGEQPNRPSLEVQDPKYQKLREDYYRGTTSGGPPADEDTEDIEEIENS